MANFKKLVNLIEQQDAAAQDETVTANNASSFLLQKYNKLAQDYNDKYKTNYNFVFPSEEDYKGLVYSATQAAVRTVKDSDRYPNIKQMFPVLDLVGLVTQSYYKGAQDASKTAESRYEDFVRKLKASPGAPLEYEPMSPWAKAVKEDYFSGKQKIDIGKLRLESPELQNQSIYFVVQKLFQVRMTGKANILDLSDSNIPKKSQQFIDQFLFNPNAFISGQKPIPEQQIKALYNDVSPSLILEIARNAYEFFVQQADVNAGGIKNLKGTTGASVDAFKMFLNNKIDWQLLKTNQTQQPAPNLQTSGLTTFSKLVHKLLAEANSSWGDKAVSQMKTQTAPSKPNPFMDENGKANYNLQNIIKHKAEVPAANNLYNSLSKLADYLRKQSEGMNWGRIFDAASKIAQGLSMGVPTVGSKS